MTWPLPLISAVVKINTSGGDITGSEPAGAQENDLLVGIVAFRGGVTFSAPSGWSERASNAGTGTSTRTGVAIYDIIRGSSAPDLTWTRTGGSSASVTVYAYPTTGTVSFVAATAGGTTSNTTTHTISGLTTASAGTLIVGAAGVLSTSDIVTWGATDPGSDSGNTVDSSNDPSNGQWRLRHNELASSGATHRQMGLDALRETAGATGDIVLTTSTNTTASLAAAAYYMATGGGGGNTISVPAGSLALTGFAPIVVATANRSVSVPAGALTLTGYAPTVINDASKTIQVPAGALTLTGYAPSVVTTGNNLVSVPLGQLTLTGYAPTVSNGEEPAVAAQAGGGGFAWASPRKGRYKYLSPPTREQMAERVRKQREELGILPKPAQKRIEAAVKKEARRAEPSLAPLAPVAAEVAQDTGVALQAVVDAIQASWDYQRALVGARMQADAAQRAEEQRQADEQARQQAEEAERQWQQRLVELRADDDEYLRSNEEARKQAVSTIRQIQKALIALLN